MNFGKIHATRRRARAGNSTICYRNKKTKLMSVFSASVLSLLMNFVITLSKQSADPLGSTATLTMS